MAQPEDIRVKINFFGHWKTLILEKRHGGDGVTALIRLWAWAAANKPSGDLTGMHDLEIVASSRYAGDDDRAWLATLKEVRFFDVGQDGWIRLHDWAEHQPWAAHAESRSQTAKRNSHARWVKEGRIHDSTPWCSSSCSLTKNANPVIGIANGITKTGLAFSNDAKGQFGNAKVPIGIAPTPTPYPIPTPSRGDDAKPETGNPGVVAKSSDVALVSKTTIQDPAGQVQLPGFTAQLARAGIALVLGEGDKARYSKLYPVMQHELDYALQQASEARARKPGYVLTVIEDERRKAHEIDTGPPAPGPAREKMTRRGEDLRRVVQSGHQNSEMFEGVFDAAK